jgi:hypothetical protein
MPIKLQLVQSNTLDSLLARLTREQRTVVKEDTGSSWIEVDVQGRVGVARFAIWKATDALYRLDRHGAAGDDPIAIEAALNYIRSA